MKRTKSNTGLILGAIIGGIILALVGFLISIPIVNDRTAIKTAKEIERIELPEHTEYMESFWKAGKLVGNGNGMQYLGGILIKSELSIDELQAYYSSYAQEEWECIVERQTDTEIPWIEHGTVSLHTEVTDSNCYIVYSWGQNESIYNELDIRGH